MHAMAFRGGGPRVLLSAIIFVLTGLVQTVCIQSVLYSGGGDRSTFLLALPNYLGIVLVYFLGGRVFRLLDALGVRVSGGEEASRVHAAIYTHQPAQHKPHSSPALSFTARLFHPERRKLFLLAFNELAGFLTGLTGLSIAGSGLYQVVFSGATVFTAILTTFLLKKPLSVSQWLCVATITAGLMITAEQVTHSTTEAGATSLVTGICFVLVSCLFYSTNYVIAEHFLDSTHRDDEDGPSVLPPPSGLDLSLYTGGSCLLLFSIYISLHTIPNWELLVTSSIRRHHGNITIILEEYFYLAVASFFHAISHYDVVATIGAVPIGVCNAIRAVSVFGVSSLLFCTHQASQCYNSRKGLSTAIVIIGALGYSATSYRIPIAPSYTLLKQTEGNSRKAVKRVRRALSASAELSRSLASLSFGFLDGSDVKQSLSSRSPDHPE